MVTDNKGQVPPSTLLPWVEPEISNMDVEDTAFSPTAGGDGGFADCTKS